MSAPIVEIRLTGVRMRIDRPQHPASDDDGRVTVDVYTEPQGVYRNGRREVVEVVRASCPFGGAWLTSEEIEAARQALAERERRMDARTI